MRFLYHPLYLEPTKYPLWRSCRVWKFFRLFPLPPPKKNIPGQPIPITSACFKARTAFNTTAFFGAGWSFFGNGKISYGSWRLNDYKCFEGGRFFFEKKIAQIINGVFFLGLKTRQKVAAQKKGRQFNIPQVLKLHPFSCITYDWISRPVDPPPTALFFVSSCLRWRSWLENGFRLHGLKVHKAVRPFRDSNFRTLGFPQKKNPGPELGNPDRKSRWCWWC